MVTVATAPNNSYDNHYGAACNDGEEEHKGEEIAKDSDSNASVTYAVGNKIAKIAKLQKTKREITAQYTRVLKQQDNNICKHAQVFQNKNNVIDGTKKLHKTEVSELRSQLKHLKSEVKNEL
jgi:hypothetical protein